MIKLINTTGRNLFMSETLIIHTFPIFKEEMVEVNLSNIKDVFKNMDATVILVKDKVIAVKAHVDNPRADIYILGNNKHCVSLAFKGTNGIVEDSIKVEPYIACVTETIDFK